MTSTEQVSLEKTVDKGLKSGALGLVSTTIIATASVAPAYSIAATLVFVVAEENKLVGGVGPGTVETVAEASLDGALSDGMAGT